MSTYQFLTKREKRKTRWRIPKRRKSYSYYSILDKTIYDEARHVIGREHWIIQMGAGVQPLSGTSNLEPPKLLWETKTEYNAAGQVVREIDQNGLETIYTYDVRGLETEVRSQSKGSDEQ
ncbi:MAG: RHS repeat protein, partial [Bacteroidales bacterium]|nr:RHS repeat protein [Bacteroidales bacterium]